MRVPFPFQALVVVAGCALASRADASIVYVDLEDPLVERLPVTLDFDDDGAFDFFFFRTESVAISIASAEDNGVMLLSPSSPFVSYLVAGTVIDDRGPYEASGALAQVFCEPGGCAWFGPFTQVNDPGFVGVEFLIDDMTHFGWIQVGVSRVNGVATIFDFAYETRPNTALAAGQVPAPGGALLLAGLACARRRRRR